MLGVEKFVQSFHFAPPADRSQVARIPCLDPKWPEFRVCLPVAVTPPSFAETPKPASADSVGSRRA